MRLEEVDVSMDINFFLPFIGFRKPRGVFFRRQIERLQKSHLISLLFLFFSALFGANAT